MAESDQRGFDCLLQISWKSLWIYPRIQTKLFHHSVNDSESELSTILLNCTSNLEDGEVAQWPYWIEDIGVTNASSEQDILHLPTCPKRRSVREYGLLEIQKRACSSSRVSFSSSGISDVLPPAAPTARPSPNINTSPPPGIQIPADYLSKH